MIEAIRESIKVKLAELSIDVRGDGVILWVKGFDSPPYYEVWLGSSGVLLCEGPATVGYFPYHDPDFYSQLLKAIRMLVAPTPILHITRSDNVAMLSILTE